MHFVCFAILLSIDISSRTLISAFQNHFCKGLCNFGKLNYFLGAGAQRDGRDAKYPNIDFCKTPDAICSREEYPELKWIAGFFYWMQVSKRATLEDIVCLNIIYIKTKDVLLIRYCHTCDVLQTTNRKYRVTIQMDGVT